MSNHTPKAGSSGSEENLDPGLDIMSCGKLALFLRDTAAGAIDVSCDGMPGLTFHIPAKSSSAHARARGG